jgi:hypothetical protein
MQLVETEKEPVLIDAQRGLELRTFHGENARWRGRAPVKPSSSANFLPHGSGANLGKSLLESVQSGDESALFRAVVVIFWVSSSRRRFRASRWSVVRNEVQTANLTR